MDTSAVTFLQIQSVLLFLLVFVVTLPLKEISDTLKRIADAVEQQNTTE